MNCHQCQKELSSETSYRFCPFCGTQLDAGTSDTAVDAAAIDDDDTIPTKSPFHKSENENETDNEKPAGEKKRSFSETAWFMASTLPEDLDDATPENYSDIDKMNEPYEQTSKLSSPLRKEFSLSETAQHKAIKDDKDE